MTDVAQGPPAFPAVAGTGPHPAGTHAQSLTQQNLMQQSTQQLGAAGLQALMSSHLSHQSSEPLSHQSSGVLHGSPSPLRQHGSTQLHMQLPRQLPQASSIALAPQFPAGQLRHQPSGQMSQSSSGHMSARQGSGHLGHDLITHGLRGSQIALELQAADQAQQQAAAAAERASAPPEATQPVATNQAMVDGLSYQATDPRGQADTAYQQTSAAAGPDLHASHIQMHSAGGSYTRSSGPGLQQQREQQQEQQLLFGVQPPLQSSATAPQPRAGDMYASAHASSNIVNSRNVMHGSEGQLASPDIGLKLGQAHSPGLSEDALGGDQEFMDAMQAMAGQFCQLHASM